MPALVRFTQNTPSINFHAGAIPMEEVKATCSFLGIPDVPSQRRRVARGIALSQFQPPKLVSKNGSELWKQTSQTNPGTTFQVRISRDPQGRTYAECGCPDFHKPGAEHQRMCKHIVAVLLQRALTSASGTSETDSSFHEEERAYVSECPF